jgi:hypothetical protein
LITADTSLFEFNGYQVSERVGSPTFSRLLSLWWLMVAHSLRASKWFNVAFLRLVNGGGNDEPLQLDELLYRTKPDA